MRWYQGYRATSWRVDETYVKVGGRWKYLFRAVDKHGRLIDFMLADRRNTRAAHCFLGKALTTMRNWPPSSITTSATIKGFEVMRMIRRGHCLTCKPHAKDEVRFINKLFNVFPSPLDQTTQR